MVTVETEHTNANDRLCHNMSLPAVLPILRAVPQVCLGAHWEQHQKVCKSIRKQQEQAKAQQRGCNVLHTYDGFAQPPA